jgi:hypothetical protein
MRACPNSSRAAPISALAAVCNPRPEDCGSCECTLTLGMVCWLSEPGRAVTVDLCDLIAEVTSMVGAGAAFPTPCFLLPRTFCQLGLVNSHVLPARSCQLARVVSSVLSARTCWQLAHAVSTHTLPGSQCTAETSAVRAFNEISVWWWRGGGL